MSTTTILTTRTTAHGILCIVRQDGAYQVAWYDPGIEQATMPVPDGQFWEWSAALRRLENEVVRREA